MGWALGAAAAVAGRRLARRLLPHALGRAPGDALAGRVGASQGGGGCARAALCAGGVLLLRLGRMFAGQVGLLAGYLVVHMHRPGRWQGAASTCCCR